MNTEFSLKLDEKDKNRIEWKYLCYGKNKTESKLHELAMQYSPKEGVLLDIGCGGGGFSRHFDDYIGVDINYSALVKARQTRSGSAKRIFIHGDALRIPLQTNSVGYFVCNSMLEHTKEPMAVLKEIYRVCQNGGIFIIPCRDKFSFVYDPINYIRIKLNFKPINYGAFGYGHYNVLTFKQWIQNIRNSGFVIDNIIPFDNSLFTQLEFFFVSIFLSQKDYGEIPTKTIGEVFFKRVQRLHRLIGIFDIDTKKAFSQCFIVSKKEERKK